MADTLTDEDQTKTKTADYQKFNKRKITGSFQARFLAFPRISIISGQYLLYESKGLAPELSGVAPIIQPIPFLPAPYSYVDFAYDNVPFIGKIIPVLGKVRYQI